MCKENYGENSWTFAETAQKNEAAILIQAAARGSICNTVNDLKYESLKTKTFSKIKNETIILVTIPQVLEDALHTDLKPVRCRLRMNRNVLQIINDDSHLIVPNWQWEWDKVKGVAYKKEKTNCGKEGVLTLTLEEVGDIEFNADNGKNLVLAVDKHCEKDKKPNAKTGRRKLKSTPKKKTAKEGEGAAPQPAGASTGGRKRGGVQLSNRKGVV
jgi:hypothetical protein